MTRAELLQQAIEHQKTDPRIKKVRECWEKRFSKKTGNSADTCTAPDEGGN